MAEGISETDKESGPLQPGTVWSTGRSCGSIGEEGMDTGEDVTPSTTREGQFCFEISGEAQLGIQSTRTTNSLGKNRNNSNARVARSTLVGRVDKVSKGADAIRKIATSRTRKVAGEQWKKKWLASVMDGFAFQKLAAASKRQYQRRISKHLDWVWETKRENGTSLGNIKAYLEELSQTKSGTNVHSTKSILLAMFREELGEEERVELDRFSQIRVRDANERNPTKRHPAEAVSILELRTLVTRATKLKLFRKEELSLEVFIITFCTMSRVGEIARIRVDDIIDQGEAIRIRPKTEGATGKGIIKCVKGDGNLDPVEILKRRGKEGCVYYGEGFRRKSTH